MSQHADDWAQLADAFVDRHYGSLRGRVRTHVIHDHLRAHLPVPPLTVVDVGGGAGNQSIPLARDGYAVTIVDPSAEMLRRAEEQRAAEPGLADRVRLVQASGEDAPSTVGETFGAVLCHGVLPYLDDPEPLVDALCRLTAPGGHVSIVAKNVETLAVLHAHRGEWAEAIAAFDSDRQINGLGVDTRGDHIDHLSGLLQARGVDPVGWYGVRLFTDGWTPDRLRGPGPGGRAPGKSTRSVPAPQPAVPPRRAATAVTDGGTNEFETHRHRRSLFGSDAAGYALGRPGYPDRVYELLRERCGLGPGTRVVEIGPGTGQATRELLDAGASVIGVELNHDLADYVATTFEGDDLRIVVGAFEEVDLEPSSADLVTSATAFHWVPTEVGLRRVAEILVTGGSVALWWNVYGDENRPDPFHEALQPILAEMAPSLQLIPGAGNARTGTPPYGLDVDERIAEIAAVGRFGDVYHETVAWTGVHRADEIRAMFATFSPWLALPVDQRDRTLDALEQLVRDEFGGVVERPYLTPVYTARKVR